MRKITAFIALALFLVLLSISVSAASMLEIKEVTVKVDGNRESAADESGGTIKVPPASTLNMKVKIVNNFDSAIEGSKIKNIAVTGVLESIDDGDDIEIDANDFDLLAGRDKTITLDFNIPLKLETDATYKLTLTVEGKDANSTKHTDTVEYDVDSDKESHELRFMQKELMPATVSCTQSTQLTVRIINTGQNDETVNLAVDASQLGFTKTENFEVVEDYSDDANEFELVQPITFNKISPGTYPVFIKATYYDGKKTLSDTLNLVVQKCGSDVPVVTPPDETEPVVTNTPPVTQPVVTTPATTPVEVVTQPTRPVSYPQATVATPRTSYSSSSWFDNNKWLVIILAADVVLVLVGIIVVVAVLKRRQ